MKNLNSSLALLLFLGLGAFFGHRALSQRTLLAFVLKGEKGGVEAYRVSFPLGDAPTSIVVLELKGGQRGEAAEILKQQNSSQLLTLAKEFGTWQMVVGIPNAGESWPWYLGGGRPFPSNQEQEASFDNLGIFDRLFLSLAVKPPPPAPFKNFELAVDLTRPATLTAAVTPVPHPTPPVPVPKAVVRVEILNGCGITNAADWVARRLQGQGIVITDVQNADNFRYSQSLVKSSVGVPVALEEALERVGLAKDSVQEETPAPGAPDVVVIVGKDYLKLKARFHGRNRR